MPVTISDDVLQQAGMTERDARIEIACRLYDAGKLYLWPAAQLARLTRDEFWAELLARGLPVFTITEKDLQSDLETLDRVLGAEGRK
jgi:predicted HTH domain antitoxin